jgi:Carboxypeptidase regulatory-like domain/TonB dependent receptor
VGLVFLGLLLLMLISGLSIAQTTTSGGLTGVVADPSGAVIPNADVEIKNISKGTTQSAITDREGGYRFFFLAPARYTLTVARAGFETEKRAVDVLLGPPVTVNIALRVAQATTTVSVTEEAPLIHAENGDVSTTFNASQISEVPNPGNDLVYSVLTTPGAIMSIDGPAGAGFSLLGMPATSNVITIDGMNENENGNNVADVGSLNLLLGQNQIEEVTVVGTPYSGQAGGVAGGQISFLTKSGSQAFHGNLQYYWNGRVLNANDWFSNAYGSPRPFDNAHQWAGSLGGPIVKDKLFFFFDTEGMRVFTPQPPSTVLIPSLEFEHATLTNIDSIFGPNSASDVFYNMIFNLYNAAPGAASALPGSGISTDPSGCKGFADPNDLNGPGHGNVPCARNFFWSRSRASQETLSAGRFDWNAGTNDRAFLRLQYDRSHNPFYSDPISSLFDSGVTGPPWWQGQISETHTFGSSAASQFLVAGSYHNSSYQVNNPTQALAAFPGTLSFGCCTTDLFATLGSGSISGSGRADTRYQISEDVVKTWGKHKFGFGANFRHINWTGTNTPGLPSLFAQTYGAFYWGGVDNHNDPAPGVTQLGQGFVTGGASNRFSFYEIGLYGQDEWRTRPNLTLTLSLRAEHQSNPVCKQRCFARFAGPFQSISHDPTQPYDKAILINQRQGLPSLDAVVWSPRFSFAWQPFGAKHSSVVRGGIGVFYDTVHGYTGTNNAYNPPLNNFFSVSGDNLAPNEIPGNLFQDAGKSNDLFVAGFKAGQTLAQIQAVDSNFFPPSASGWTGRPHPPQYQRWSLEWEQGFGVYTSLSVGYHGYHGIHTQVADPDANAYGFGSLPKALCTSPPVLPCADPRFSGVTKLYSAAVSNYNGMVVSLKHRFRSQGQLQANYTFSHAFDEVSNGGDYSFNFGGDNLSPQDPNNLRGTYGPAEYDIRHSFDANYVWEIPFKTLLGGHGPNLLVKGWEVSGTVFARSGEPNTAFDAAQSQTLVQKNNYFGLLYAVPIRAPGTAAFCGEGAAIPLAPHPCFPPQVLPNGQPNPDALFLQSGCETGFNTGILGPYPACLSGGTVVSGVQRRNSFRAPKFVWTDFAITKNTKVPGWDKATLGIGFQFFNLFNHTNFEGSDNFMSNPTFGEIGYLNQPPTGILGASSPDRIIQLKAQLRF